MGALQGLPGTSGRPIECSFFRSVTAGISFLKKDHATTAAGNNGAISIWIDDAGKYRVMAYRYCVTINEHVYNTLKDVKDWLKVWLPLIQ